MKIEWRCGLVGGRLLSGLLGLVEGVKSKATPICLRADVALWLSLDGVPLLGGQLSVASLV